MGSKLGRTTSIIVLVLAGTAALVLSPFAFDVVDSPSTDWARLADIGQAYGSVSVFISAVALVGVAASLSAQNRQASIAREYSHRDRHHELLKLSLDDPALMECWGAGPDQTPQQRRQMFYVNMIFTFWYSSWRQGALPEAGIRVMIADIFDGEPALAFWKDARLLRQSAHTDRWEQRFDVMIEQEYQRALLRTAPPAPAPPAPPE